MSPVLFVVAGSAAQNSVEQLPYQKGQVYRLSNGERVRVMSLTRDFDTEEVILIMEWVDSRFRVSDMTVAEFVALQPVLEAVG